MPSLGERAAFQLILAIWNIPNGSRISESAAGLQVWPCTMRDNVTKGRLESVQNQFNEVYHRTGPLFLTFLREHFESWNVKVMWWTETEFDPLHKTWSRWTCLTTGADYVAFSLISGRLCQQKQSSSRIRMVILQSSIHNPTHRLSLGTLSNSILSTEKAALLSNSCKTADHAHCSKKNHTSQNHPTARTDYIFSRCDIFKQCNFSSRLHPVCPKDIEWNTSHTARRPTASPRKLSHQSKSRNPRLRRKNRKWYGQNRSWTHWNEEPLKRIKSGRTIYEFSEMVSWIWPWAFNKNWDRSQKDSSAMTIWMTTKLA
jgi:hypothetical protein